MFLLLSPIGIFCWIWWCCRSWSQCLECFVYAKWRFYSQLFARQNYQVVGHGYRVSKYDVWYHIQLKVTLMTVKLVLL